MNPDGHKATLQAAHPGNRNAVKSGLYSRTGRILESRADEIASALMNLPHVVDVEAIAAEEIGSIVAQLEAIDRDLGERGRRDRKTLLEHKARLTRELRAWSREFGATPLSRATWTRQLAEGESLAEAIRRRRDAIDGEAT